MTNLVDEHPLVAAVDAKLADLAQQRSDFEARIAKIAEQDAKAQQTYDQALQDALLRGGPMPAPLVRQLPELADVEVRHRFLAEEAQLREERQRAVAAAFQDVLDEARTRAKKLAAAAHAPLQELLAAMTEVGQLQAAVKTCRDARNSEARNRNSPDARMHFGDLPMTVEEFVRIVASAGDPIDILDLAGNRPVRSRSTGMTWSDIAQLTPAS
jgi:hypothetical protein